VQSDISTLGPAAVELPGTSRHLLPYTCSSPFDREAHCWLVPPLQSQISNRVPLVVDRPGTSRHRFEPAPRSTVPVPPPPLPLPPPLLVSPQPYWSRSSPDWLVTRSEEHTS